MDQTDRAALAAVERSLPDPNRPRMRDRDEARLGKADRKSALAYAEAELATDRLDALASDGIPVEEIIGDTTLVNVIGELRAVALAGEEGDEP